MEPVIILATAPAIVALVNLCKRFGLTGAWSALVAVVLGVALAVGDYLWGASGLYQAAAGGLLLGLAAAGLYDLTSGGTAARRALPETDEQ